MQGKEKIMTDNLPALTDEYCIKEFGWTKSQFEVVKRTYFNGLNNDEVKIFAHVCKHTGLDPFLKQIYPVMRSGKMTIQTAIDGYRLIAERTGRYSPGREPTFTYKKDGLPQSATAYVKKMTADGTWHEVSATAFFDEYNPGVGPFWKKMPHTMIAKCAEALALRKSFPAELSGINTQDEMDQADVTKLPQAECVDVTPAPMPEVPAPSVVTISESQAFAMRNELALLKADVVERFHQAIRTDYNADCIEELPQSEYKKIMGRIQYTIDINNKAPA